MLSFNPPDTAQAIADQHGVSRATVIRDGKRAEAIEKLAETAPEQAGSVATLKTPGPEPGG